MSKQAKMKKAETPLERKVAKWLREYGRGYDDGAKGAYDDLMYGGCQSGIVGELIYYTDTMKFYRRHQDEINSLLAENLQDIGILDTGPASLFGNKWDADDPLALGQLNQNLLAWFGFEETARRLMEYGGSDEE